MAVGREEGWVVVGREEGWGSAEKKDGWMVGREEGCVPGGREDGWVTGGREEGWVGRGCLTPSLPNCEGGEVWCRGVSTKGGGDGVTSVGFSCPFISVRPRSTHRS